MFTSLIVILIILAAFALLYWGVSQLALPAPVRVVVLVIIGLIMLGLIYQYAVGGAPPFGLLRR